MNNKFKISGLFILGAIGVIAKSIRSCNAQPKKNPLLEYNLRSSSKDESALKTYDYPKDCYINLSEVKDCNDINIVVCHPCNWIKYPLPKEDQSVVAQLSDTVRNDITIALTVAVNKYSKDATEEFMRLLISEQTLKSKFKRNNVEIQSFKSIKNGELTGSQIVTNTSVQGGGYYYGEMSSFLFKNKVINIQFFVGAQDKKIATETFNKNKAMFESYVAKAHLL